MEMDEDADPIAFLAFADGLSPRPSFFGRFLACRSAREPGGSGYVSAETESDRAQA